MNRKWSLSWWGRYFKWAVTYWKLPGKKYTLSYLWWLTKDIIRIWLSRRKK